jgi:hypothetical protein
MTVIDCLLNVFQLFAHYNGTIEVNFQFIQRRLSKLN